MRQHKRENSDSMSVARCFLSRAEARVSICCIRLGFCWSRTLHIKNNATLGPESIPKLPCRPAPRPKVEVSCFRAEFHLGGDAWASLLGFPSGSPEQSLAWTLQRFIASRNFYHTKTTRNVKFYFMNLPHDVLLHDCQMGRMIFALVGSWVSRVKS